MAPTTPRTRIATPGAPRFAPGFDQDHSQVDQNLKRAPKIMHAAPRNSAFESASSTYKTAAATYKGKGRYQGPATPERKRPAAFPITPESKPIRKRSAAEASDDDVSSSEEFTPRKRHIKHDCHANKSTVHGLPLSRSARSKKVNIYTDSKERLPELDLSPSNPFVGPSHGTTVELPYMGPAPKTAAQIEWEQAIKNNEGILWTFRGEKFLRRWDKSVTQGEQPQPGKNIGGSDCHNQSGLRIAKHTARTYLQPRRILFTPAQMRSFALTGRTHPQRDLEEEDLMNDNPASCSDDSSISSNSSSSEDSAASDVDSEADEVSPAVVIPETPAQAPAVEEPTAPGPVEPITSADQPTVAGTHDGPSTNTRSRSSVASPFDHWPRTKSCASSSRTRPEKGSSSQDSGPSQDPGSSQGSAPPSQDSGA